MVNVYMMIMKQELSLSDSRKFLQDEMPRKILDYFPQSMHCKLRDHGGGGGRAVVM